MALTITTNGIPRSLLDWDELTEKEKKEFTYITHTNPDTALHARFVRYRGWVYDMEDMARAPDALAPWDGYVHDTFFSGVVFRYTDDYTAVIAGRYMS